MEGIAKLGRQKYLLLFHTCQHFSYKIQSYLNGRDDHVDSDLALSDLLERRHHVSDVVQVFDWSVETLGEVVDEVKDGLHLCAVLEVTCLAVL